MAKRRSSRNRTSTSTRRPAHVAKSYGPSAPKEILQAEALAGMTGGTFSPGEPIRPYDGYNRTPRSHDYVAGYNIAARPRRNERVTFDTLRALVESYDVAQICIWHRIDSIRSLNWSLVPMKGAAGIDLDAAIQLGEAILAKPDRKTPFKTWVGKYLYDVLAFDAGTLYRMRNLAGRAIGLKVVDGTTIAPLLDEFGDSPDSPAPAYVQYVQGVPWNWLDRADIIYEPFRATSNTPYGRAPIETILLNASTDLRFQTYFMKRFTSGNIPEAFASAPEGWTPDQIKDFQEQWDALLYGDTDAKHQVKWVPNGTDLAWSNEQDFSPDFSLFLMRKTCSAYHVTPTDLGFTEEVNRATSDTQVDIQFRIGDLPLIEHLQGILTAFIQEDVGLPLEFAFDTGQEKEDRLATAQADKIYVELGAIGVSEVRERVFGLAEPDGQPVPRFVMTTRSGPVPLSALMAVSGQVDAESGAPVPGGQLPHHPFAPIEGVTPQKPPSEPPLAVVEYPADNAGSAAAAAQAAAAPVVKEQTAGLTAETGTYSYDLDRAAEEPPVEVTDGSVVEIAKAELGAFRRFVKTRQRAGRWRPFEFRALDAVTAHRLNDAGRATVRKAAGELIAAGLCVQAADTGRVLVIQRALDPADPASGTWEFPGGHIEDGEDPRAAAGREWQEETGCLLPLEAMVALAFAGTSGSAATWLGSNGVYQGFVVTVPSETSIDWATRGQVTNPDDPDGDQLEAIAWWEPEMLAGNPVVRAELAADMQLVLAAVGLAETAAEVLKASDADPKACSWRDGAPKTPQHAFDLRLTDYYGPRITTALHAMLPASKLRAAIEAAGSVVIKAADPSLTALRAAARDSLAGAANTSELEQQLRELMAEAFQTGAFAASQQIGDGAVTLAGVSSIDWANWEPGDAAAAALVSNGGLADLLDAADTTIRGVADTTLDRLGNAIGDGLSKGHSIDTIAASLGGIISDPARAEMIAHTETARAQTVASRATYAANGIGEWDWILSDDACDECVEAADNGPYRVDDDSAPSIPGHPYCRCSCAPRADSVTGDTSGSMVGAELTDLLDATALDEAASAAADALTADTAADEAATAAEDEFAALSDDDLSGRMSDAAIAGDDETLNRILAELDRRDEAQAAEQKKAAKAARDKERRDAKREAEQAAKDAKYDELVAGGADPEQAFADAYGLDEERMKTDAAIASLRANGYTGKGFDELVRNAFKDYAEQSWLDAENQTNGYLLNKAGEAAGINPRALFSGPESAARKYASDELLDYWQANGRLTVEDFKTSLLGGKFKVTGYWH